MQISLANFHQTLPLLRQASLECDFYSIDTEFTGSNLPSQPRMHDYDSYDSKYHKLASAVKQYVALEVGICFFKKQQQN